MYYIEAPPTTNTQDQLRELFRVEVEFSVSNTQPEELVTFDVRKRGEQS